MIENIFQSDIFFVERTHKNFFVKSFHVRTRATDERLYAEQPVFQLRTKIDVYSDEDKVKRCFSIIEKFSCFRKEYCIMDATGRIIGFIKERRACFTAGNYTIEDSKKKKVAALKNTAFANWRESMLSWFRQNYSFDFLLSSVKVGEISIEQGFKGFPYRAIVNLSQDQQRIIDRGLAISLKFGGHIT